MKNKTWNLCWIPTRIFILNIVILNQLFNIEKLKWNGVFFFQKAWWVWTFYNAKHLMEEYKEDEGADI